MIPCNPSGAGLPILACCAPIVGDRVFSALQRAYRYLERGPNADFNNSYSRYESFVTCVNPGGTKVFHTLIVHGDYGRFDPVVDINEIIGDPSGYDNWPRPPGVDCNQTALTVLQDTPTLVEYVESGPCGSCTTHNEISGMGNRAGILAKLVGHVNSKDMATVTSDRETFLNDDGDVSSQGIALSREGLTSIQYIDPIVQFGPTIGSGHFWFADEWIEARRALFSNSEGNHGLICKVFTTIPPLAPPVCVHPYEAFVLEHFRPPPDGALDLPMHDLGLVTGVNRLNAFFSTTGGGPLCCNQAP